MDTKVKIPKFKLKSRALKNHFSYASLLTSIIDEIKKIPVIESLKLSQDLTCLVCTIIESVNSKATKSIHKKTLCTEILQNVFNLTLEEQAEIHKQIDFICSNDLHLSQSPLYDSLKAFFF